MERGACAHYQRATRHAPLDRPGRGHLPDGVAWATQPVVIVAGSSLPAVVNVGAGDYFELIARQTPGSAKNVAADELTWFEIEVVE
jgi:hypothetical protein